MHDERISPRASVVAAWLIKIKRGFYTLRDRCRHVYPISTYVYIYIRINVRSWIGEQSSVVIRANMIEVRRHREKNAAKTRGNLLTFRSVSQLIDSCKKKKKKFWCFSFTYSKHEYANVDFRQWCAFWPRWIMIERRERDSGCFRIVTDRHVVCRSRWNFSGSWNGSSDWWNVWSRFRWSRYNNERDGNDLVAVARHGESRGESHTFVEIGFSSTFTAHRTRFAVWKFSIIHRTSWNEKSGRETYPCTDFGKVVSTTETRSIERLNDFFLLSFFREILSNCEI